MDQTSFPSTRWLTFHVALALLLMSFVVAPGPAARAADDVRLLLAEPIGVADTSTVATTSRLVARPSAVRGIANAASRTDALARIAGVVEVEDLFDGLLVLSLDQELTLTQATALADQLVADGLAEHAEPDPPTTIAGQPNDPLWTYQWGPRSRGLPSAWDFTVGGNRQPIVAVLDTGVTATNELSGRVLPGFNALDGSTNVTDSNGHGTLSATVIAARGDDGVGMAGQCWSCQILPVKVMSDAGSGSMSQMAEGIVWAVDNGADIISISAGGPDGSSTLASAVQYAEDSGVLIVVSAGNSGDTGVLYPAAYARTLSVAGSQLDGSRYSWSTHGPDVDVAAPGCNVAQKPDERYYEYCGTSSAAPFVTGLLALALDVEATLSPAQLRTRARSTSEAVDYVATGIVSGPGIVPGGTAYEGSDTGGEDGDPDDLPGVGLDPIAAVSLHTPSRGDLQISLSWSATSGGSGSGYNYQLHRSTGPACDLSSPRLTTTQNRSYTDRSVAHGRTYRYCVYAFDGAGARSARSNVRSATAQDTSPPPRPNLSVLGTGDRSVDLSWSTVSDPTGPVTYHLHRTTGSTCSAGSPVVWSGRTTSVGDEGLRNARTYRYCITATDGAGNRSTASGIRGAVPARSSGRCTALTGNWTGGDRDSFGWWCDGRVRLRNPDGTVVRYSYGRRGDVPVVADWNGDGRDTVSIIRDGTWHLNNRLAGGASSGTFTYGRVSQGDVPIAGSWSGTARDMPGIIRDGEWHLREQQAGGSADHFFVYGRLTRGDRALWGDWDGNGRDTIGIVRQGTWHLRNRLAAGQSDLSYVYGRVLAGDTPVSGDWTGDSRDTPAIVRDGVWMLRFQHRAGNADAHIAFRRP